MRQIVLDTETTGLDASAGHRIIEIGCIEIVNRKITNNRYHVYLNPQREIDPGAVEVHGLTTEFLASKPLFADIVQEFVDFISGAELVIHNAPFDVGFINAELKSLGDNWHTTEYYSKVFDTLTLARDLHPGQRNSLDALCRRYDIDNTHRELHGALLDAELLADVYLLMTGGQVDLTLATSSDSKPSEPTTQAVGTRAVDRLALPVIEPTAEELAEHERILTLIDGQSADGCLWTSN